MLDVLVRYDGDLGIVREACPALVEACRETVAQMYPRHYDTAH